MVDQDAQGLDPKDPSNPTLLEEAPPSLVNTKMHEIQPKDQEPHQRGLGFRL